MESAKQSKQFKIICTDYPLEFDSDKLLCKSYFKQFGKIRKIVVKHKQRALLVEYANENGCQNALQNAGEFKGHFFNVSRSESVPTRKKVVKKHSLSYIDSDEIQAELAAMGGTSNQMEVTFHSPKSKVRTPKLNRVWQKESVRKSQAAGLRKKVGTRAIKKKQKEKIEDYSVEQVQLIKIVKSAAHTNEEKFRVLDARDKLLRIEMKKNTQRKVGPTIGTCPDMCPEKERLMREIQHQIALYEQDDNDKRVMNASKAVKQYSRSSADQEAPLPHELRPVTVLQMTMAYLMHNIMDLCENEADVNIAEWFHFLWDRTRSIRKDITQQALCCLGSVELVEQCARFHIHCSARLMGEDPSVFDQKINTENLTKCLQTLKYMYNDLHLKGVYCVNEAEFRAYIILLNLNDGNFMWEVQGLRQDIQKSPAVKFALNVYSAFEKKNYVKFFKLVRSTDYFNSCLLMRYFVQVRIMALRTLIKCFAPPKSTSLYPITELTELLHFDDPDDTIDFMRTYGLEINLEKSHFLIERHSFRMPEYSYMLERSSLVEDKRQKSVGSVVCGQDLSPEMYLALSTHKTRNSFDDNGYLIHDELFSKIESTLEESASSEMEESSPESKSPDNIFESKMGEALVPSKSRQENLFIRPKQIFAPPVPSEIVKNEPINIFAQKHQDKLPVSGSIFGSSTLAKPALDQHDGIFTKNIFSEPAKNNIEPTKFNIFTQKDTPTEKSKSGGFNFTLVKKTPTNDGKSLFPFSFTPPVGLVEKRKRKIEEMERTQNEEDIKVLELQRQRLKEEILKETEKEEEERKRQEEKRKKIEEAAEKIKLEMELKKKQEMKEIEEQNRKKREEEQKLKELQKKLEEELVRKKQQIQLQERQKNLEIQNTVNLLVKEMLKKVDEQMREEKLSKIKRSIHNRFLLTLCHRWRNAAIRKIKKRKALDCGPVWLNSRDATECARELHMESQELTLSLAKRYKQGRPVDIHIAQEPIVGTLNLFNLTYAALRRRLFELKEKWHQHIYWKVTVSLPGQEELDAQLHKLETMLQNHINWKENNKTLYIEDHKTVTYCVEKQQGHLVKYWDANGFIFIAKKLDSSAKKRIYENLRNFGVYSKLPLVVILQDATESDDYLRNLKETGIISDYITYSCNLCSEVIPDIIDNGLVFLSKRVEKYPPLELETLASFLTKHLYIEPWKKAASFAKWNHAYKICLRDPNVVIGLYNQGLGLLQEIIMDKHCKEFAQFPEIFGEYLPSPVPDFFPCDYRYFPPFWSKPFYLYKLEKMLRKLVLPKFLEKWPPADESDLLVSISKYCTEVFENAKDSFIAVFSVLKESRENEDYASISWIQAIEVLSKQKLKEVNLTLDDNEFQNSVFKTFVVVYITQKLNEFSNSDWFYRNNPIIEEYKSVNEISDNRTKKRVLDLGLDEDVFEVIEKAEKILRKSSTQTHVCERKKQIEILNESIEDLEDSIRVAKKINKITQNFF
ncbi:protein xmas isoform X2 [Cylas formicarius]|uniref:protein xmas isoform X2 n=1 Tax=Cylas formicarius TaxID=197179 RepID=UPI002958C02C|nr:protein xmas isoform X2 [Cylas formicarius]